MIKKIKLFCFPYAGGSAVIFNKWKQYLASYVELVPVELAGRGRRIHEALYKDIPDVVDDVLSLILEKITHSPYALFGHSLGSTIIYSLAQRIRDHRLPAPEHIFFSGRSAPHLRRENDKVYYLMNDEEFRNELIALGGTPPEVFEQPALLELFLPLLKNDFRLAETQLHSEIIHPLDGSITVFLGKDDNLTAEQCDGWKKHTRQMCNIHHFEGGHFFLHQETEQIVLIINRVLNECNYATSYPH